MQGARSLRALQALRFLSAMQHEGRRGLGSWRWPLLASAALMAAAACGGGPAGGERTLTVFAASSLTDVLQEAGRAFEREHVEARVTFSFSASSTLRVQLGEGARADVFASADQRQMDQARDAGVVEGEPVIFATSRLAVIVPADGARVAGLADLARPGLKLALAAPQVPAGAYTEAAFRKIGADPCFGPEFVERVRRSAVTQAINVRQAVAAVELGQADAAIAYATDAVGPKLRAIPLPDELQVTVVYPIAVVRGAPEPGLARQLIDFLRSARGQAVLRRHGFGVPEGG